MVQTLIEYYKTSDFSIAVLKRIGMRQKLITLLYGGLLNCNPDFTAKMNEAQCSSI